MAGDMCGTLLVVHFLGDLVSNPRGLAMFIHWAQSQQAEGWRRWAQAKGRAETDGSLVADAVLACQSAILEGNRLALDKLAAVLEVQQAFEGGGHGGSPGP